MKLPFTSEEFLNVFADYNQTVFPMQVVLFLLALAAIYMLFKKAIWADMAITSILAFFWIWMGLVYHILFFSSINKAAYLFGTLFIVEGGLFLWNGVYRKKLSFHFTSECEWYCRCGFNGICFAPVSCTRLWAGSCLS